MSGEDNEIGNLSHNEYTVILTPRVRITFVFDKISSRMNHYTLSLLFKSGIINTAFVIQDPIDFIILDKIISALTNARERIAKGE